MVVQHNMQAMNANRMLNITTGSQAKSTEKLSSGYRINRAADDAAGLSISEKMRKQIKGLDRASSNAQDGISAVQTAEGALTEVHSMLQRMNELATQASNGTNSESDRKSIQDEIDQLTTEIDRVSETTKFNETYMLKGNAAGTSSDMNVNAHDAGIDGKLTDDGATATFKLNSALEDGDKITIANKEYTIGQVNKGADTTAGFAKDGTLDTVDVKTGDSYTDSTTGITYTLVDKIATAGLDTGDYAITSAKSAFTIEYADGTIESYSVKDTPTTANGEICVADAKETINKALDRGAKVTLTKKADGSACDLEVVKALQTTGKEREVSITAPADSTLAKFEAAGGFTMKAGDKVSISGKETVFTANDPKTSADVASVVNKLAIGDEMRITRGNKSKDILIANVTDVVKGEYTAEDALKLLQDGDQVGFKIAGTNTDATTAAAAVGITNDTTLGTNMYTIIGSTKANETDDSVITKEEALSKIAQELEKASSIGADVAAKVTNNKDGSFTITKGTVEVKDKLSFSLHVGSDADMTNKINVDFESMSAAGLGVKGINIQDDTGAAATYAIDAISDAISKVSAQRSALGAVQNRLEHTIANLDNVAENTTSAESSIRDTDMATEMVNFSKNNILAQAGQSMLAQANQSNQGVLSLLG